MKGEVRLEQSRPIDAQPKPRAPQLHSVSRQVRARAQHVLDHPILEERVQHVARLRDQRLSTPQYPLRQRADIDLQLAPPIEGTLQEVLGQIAEGRIRRSRVPPNTQGPVGV